MKTLTRPATEKAEAAQNQTCGSKRQCPKPQQEKDPKVVMNRKTQGRRLVMMSEAVLPEERLQPGLFRPTRISTWPRTPELKELPRPRTAKSRYTTLLPPGKNLHTDTGDTYTSPSKTLHTGIPAGQSLSPGCTASHLPFAASTHMSRHGGRIRHGQYG